MGLKGHEHRSRSNFISIATGCDEIIPFVMNRSKRYSSRINREILVPVARAARFYRLEFPIFYAPKNCAPRYIFIFIKLVATCR